MKHLKAELLSFSCHTQFFNKYQEMMGWKREARFSHCLYRFIMAAVVLTAVISSCSKASKQEEETIIIEETKLSLAYAQKELSRLPNEFELTVTSNGKWSIESDSEWVFIDPDHSEYINSMSLIIRVDENKTASKRTATLKFLYGEKTAFFKIIQDKLDAVINVSLASISFGHHPAEKNILVTSNCGWLAKENAQWIKIRPSTGLVGNFEMNIYVEPNQNLADRTGEIRIWNEDYNTEKIVKINQSGQKTENNHDYIDEYGINWGQGFEYGGLIWAPVNCGYNEKDYPYGKMYQWGRKFGLGYKDETYSDISGYEIAENWTGKNGEENASIFYKSADDSKFAYDWIKEGDNTFWNLAKEENPAKNKKLDPCPDGWRIPTAFEMKTLVDYAAYEWVIKENIPGYRFFDGSENGNTEFSLFFPAGGRLNVQDGKALDRNFEAYYWTISTTETGSSTYLYFNKNDHSLNKQGSRAGGCLLRCIKE